MYAWLDVVIDVKSFCSGEETREKCFFMELVALSASTSWRSESSEGREQDAEDDRRSIACEDSQHPDKLRLKVDILFIIALRNATSYNVA